MSSLLKCPSKYKVKGMVPNMMEPLDALDDTYTTHDVNKLKLILLA